MVKNKLNTSLKSYQQEKVKVYKELIQLALKTKQTYIDSNRPQGDPVIALVRIIKDIIEWFIEVLKPSHIHKECVYETH